MKQHAIASLIAIGLLLALLPASFAQAPPEPQFYPERVPVWQKAIEGFEARDRANGEPAPGGVLFVGSSSIVMWKSLKENFPGMM